ncbi:glycosyltransferase family 2 protein [Candidatus Woesebacteria bacterium]|nr:glycosyltransferase family 2 protein [Candidatus Woesebacteria bacterium]MCD8507173.1 glycosyltransferase family 2 protein [Candidatus Woesebacteria bacterium]MCD8527064.1 glycosyltransferase family 2 protein [Candidatus Woesebacteria bacterium]MCD8545934.1 glycosyltransferase family 2 protein [Candidatus Woesebacteria bacterium]
MAESVSQQTSRGTDMPIDTKRIGVVIVHYNNADNVRECLLSLGNTTNAAELHPIIVDNASTQPVSDVVADYNGNITLLRLEENTGFTGANNHGIAWAMENLQSDVVILLNDDTIVEKSALETLIATVRSNAKIGAAVPKIYFNPGNEFHAGYEDDHIGRVFWYGGGVIDWTEVVAFHRAVDEVDRGQYNRPEGTPFATGCCLALRTEALQKHGAFDDKYFLYFEDVDLSCRLQKHGYKVRYQPQAVIWHKNAGSSGSGSPLHVYYQTRNRYLFGFRYAPWRTKLFLLKHMWRQYRSGDPVIKRAILDVLKNNYGINSELHHS